MIKLQISEMENLIGGRLCIGTGHVTEHLDGPLNCTRDCLQDYFLWIPTGGHHGCGEWVCQGGSF